jgi:hypothetical protein
MAEPIACIEIEVKKAKVGEVLGHMFEKNVSKKERNGLRQSLN